MKPGPPGFRVLGLLGMALRAGALIKGVHGVRQALRGGEVRLVILARDGSEVQKRKVASLADARGVPVGSVGSAHDLGAALGSASLSAVGVTQSEFAEEIQKHLGGE